MSDSVLIHLQPVLGIAVIPSIAWVLSENRRAFHLRLVVSALVWLYACPEGKPEWRAG